ncbi:MAG: (Fe-S)-binding protein [Thermoleophilia bacterium]
MAELVTLFRTCLGDIADPTVVRDARRCLEACGFEVVDPPGATCCGQPAFNAGFADQARRVARTTLRALASVDGPIVVPSGSCTAMIRRHWVELFHGDRDEALAREVSDRTRELSQVLVTRTDRLAGLGLRYPARAAYHDSCHMLRELGVHEEPRAVLATVDGLELVPLSGEARCCGFGGLFAVRYPEVSVAMADDRLVDARDGGVELVVSADPGCAMHLEGRSVRRGDAPRVMHLASLLCAAGVA